MLDSLDVLSVSLQCALHFVTMAGCKSVQIPLASQRQLARNAEKTVTGIRLLTSIHCCCARQKAWLQSTESTDLRKQRQGSRPLAASNAHVNDSVLTGKTRPACCNRLPTMYHVSTDFLNIFIRYIRSLQVQQVLTVAT